MTAKTWILVLLYDGFWPAVTLPNSRWRWSNTVTDKPPLNRKRVSRASQALSPICKVNTLLWTTVACYTVKLSAAFIRRFLWCSITWLVAQWECNNIFLTFWLENQRLRPGDAVFCVIDRPSLASLKWFFCVWFYGVRWLVTWWRDRTTITRPGSCSRLCFVHPHDWGRKSRSSLIWPVLSTNIIRDNNKSVVLWPTPSTSSSLSSPSSSF